MSMPELEIPDETTKPVYSCVRCDKPARWMLPERLCDVHFEEWWQELDAKLKEDERKQTNA